MKTIANEFPKEELITLALAEIAASRFMIESGTYGTDVVEFYRRKLVLSKISLAFLEAEAVTNEIVIPEPATHRNINEICPPGVNQTLFASGWNASRKSGMNSGRIPPIVKGIDAECVGWNACRAAMLQGAPVRSSMPDGVVTAEHRRVIEMLLNV